VVESGLRAMPYCRQSMPPRAPMLPDSFSASDAETSMPYAAAREKYHADRM